MSTAVLARLLYFADHGLDFTDEGHYLNSVAAPQQYAVNLPASLYGYVIKPIFDLLGGSVSALRRLNLAVTFLLAWALSIEILRTYFPAGEDDRLTRSGIASALASIALVGFSLGLFTPSYNTLAFHALMTTCLGFVLTRRDDARWNLLGWLLIGLGGWLAFMAKPSTAAALGFFVVVALVVSGTTKLKMIALSVAVAATLLLISSVIIDGSPIGLYNRLLSSIELQYLLGGGQEFGRMFRLDRPMMTFEDVVFTVVLVGIALLLALLTRGAERHLRLSLMSICGILALLTLALLAGVMPVELYRNEVLFGFVVAFVAIALLQAKRSTWADIRSPLGLSGLLLVLPHVYAFGSNNNYWTWGANVGVFWALGGLAAFAAITRCSVKLSSLLPLAFIIPLVATILTQRAIVAPYRQPANLADYTTIYDLPVGGAIVLDAGVAAYLFAARESVAEAGLAPGTDVVDLTGQSAGVLFALGLRGVGLPWLVGGYSGSDETARAALATVTCKDLAIAWILDEPGGGRSLSPDVLKSFGGDLAVDYEVASSFSPPSIDTEREMQRLLRPTRSKIAATQACENAREYR